MERCLTLLICIIYFLDESFLRGSCFDCWQFGVELIKLSGFWGFCCMLVDVICLRFVVQYLSFSFLGLHLFYCYVGILLFSCRIIVLLSSFVFAFGLVWAHWVCDLNSVCFSLDLGANYFICRLRIFGAIWFVVLNLGALITVVLLIIVVDDYITSIEYGHDP